MKLGILDTTLRDGAEGMGMALSVSDRLGIAMLLDNAGIDYIEAGNPGFGVNDREFFERAKRMGLEHARLAAFGATRRKNCSCESDAQLADLLSAGTEIVSIVGKSEKSQVAEVLRTTGEENLAMIRDTVEYLVSKGREVFFDAEHFFDGYMEDAGYAMSALETAAGAGASMLVLCDTRGGTFPDEAALITSAVTEHFKKRNIRIGAHFHNDTGCAVANSIAAARAGATDIQGTFLGVGERTGNASLAALIPSLQLKLRYEVVTPEQLRLFTRTTLHIAELCNMVVSPFEPYIGSAAFSHKAGMHIDGVKKQTSTFEHIDPSLVGNGRDILLSEIAGSAAVAEKLAELGDEYPRDPETVQKILSALRAQEKKGYQYESASASFEVLARYVLGIQKNFFRLIKYTIMGERSGADGRKKALGVVKVEVGGQTKICAAEGDGPVDALDSSLRGALETFYPQLAKSHLTDYRVRVIDPEAAAASKVRVLIDTTDSVSTWTTVGVSVDIIDASFKAVTDSIVYMLNASEKK